MKEFKALVTLSKVTGNGTWWRMSVLDETSGNEIVEVEICFNDFSKMFMGAGYGKGRVYDLGIKTLNMKREFKTELIENTWGCGTLTREQMRKIVAPYETDGFKVHMLTDLTNHHNTTGNKQAVRFIKYVPVKQ